MTVSTLRELYAFNRWANDKTLAIADGLSAEQLDRSFEMGLGSIRNTLHHIWAAELIWLERWLQGGGAVKYPEIEAGLAVSALAERCAEAHRRRDAFVTALQEADLSRRISYVNRKGETWTYELGQMLLHVCNHGIHHRAQFINMVRRAGGPVPARGFDYIFYRLEKIKEAPPPLDLATIRKYEAYADWGTRRMLDLVAKLTDAQLDRPFEMGLGTLRKTLSHLVIAEEWWHTNWTKGPAGEFPPADDSIALADLSQRFETAWAARDRFVNRLSEADLPRPVTVKPRPDLTLDFPLGVSLVQLCGHATHHRAQALNMVRQLGAPTREFDYLLMFDES
ncbi:MAG TPA: DinB family protein [Phycisphaerae bacterium]|nr:DinB family protein [Phycisphaerae bacterium]